MKIVIEGNKVTIKESYESARKRYLSLISDAESLGELDEVTRLQQEWATKKKDFE